MNLDRSKLIWVFLVIILIGILFAGYMAITKGNETGSGKGNDQVYTIRYTPGGNGTETTATATRTSDGNYKLPDGTTLSVSRDNIIVISMVHTTGSGSACECQCNCCNNGGRTPCVEPEPRELYLCSNNKLVKNKGDCNTTSTCTSRAVGKIYYCADGREVKDPEDCGGVESPIYVCSNGQEVSSVEACQCHQTMTAVAAMPPCNLTILERKFKCTDGSVVSDPSACGKGEVKTIYICSDGTKVANEADCSAQCPQQTYSTTTYSSLSSAIAANSVRVVYSCWDGKIVNERGDCLPYCNRACNCPDYEKPVCGGDGKTYRNRCYANCAGVATLTDGECPTYTCTKVGSECISPLSTMRQSLTNLASSAYLSTYGNATICCPGSACQADSTSSTGYRCQNPQPENPTCADIGQQCVRPTATVAYVANASGGCCAGLVCGMSGVCETPAPSCSQDGQNCKSDNECCNGYCNQSIYTCGNRPTCGSEGASCGGTATTALYVGNTCCSGLYCNLSTKICTQQPECPSSYCQDGISYRDCAFVSSTGSCECKYQSTCSSQRCNSAGTGCAPVSCVKEGGTCSGDSQCCSGMYCSSNDVCVTIPTCPSDYCQDGVMYTDCAFNRERESCTCASDSCSTKACNSDGTACASRTQTQSCTYEYCSNGVFYTGCYFNTQTGGCTCPTHVNCERGRCNTAGTACG